MKTNLLIAAININIKKKINNINSIIMFSQFIVNYSLCLNSFKPASFVFNYGNGENDIALFLTLITRLTHYFITRKICILPIRLRIKICLTKIICNIYKIASGIFI